MSLPVILLLALILDALLGEPDWLWSRLPHPAVLMGNSVGYLDRRLNQGRNRKIRGVLALGLLVVSAGILGALIAGLPVSGLLEVLLAAVLFAQKSLTQHVQAVADALRLSLGDGKRAVARIVGRDTTNMDETAVARAAIESAAENLSDGVVAPVFWFLLFGLPGLMIYKVVNTADSMIGYRTARHLEFGWAAARLDDLLNWVPARLTAALIIAVHLRPDIWPTIRRDAPLHRSPNAGWPEAAMAATLNVALAGPRSYDGQSRKFPFVYPEGRRKIGAGEIDRATAALWRTWWGLFGIALLIALF